MQWNDLFDNYGIKTVTKTDKAKKAYVTNAEQNGAIRAAGINPSDVRPATTFPITLVGETVQSVQASYYDSERGETAERTPESRIGRDFISHWLEVGDRVLIGNIGPQLLALKLTTATDQSTLVDDIARANPEAIYEKAKRAKGKPKTTTVTRVDFARNPFVVRGALLRSGGKCEMPDCKTTLFLKEDGVPFLEVHHITPLSEDGDDSLENAAALCPNCHREQHHGKLKKDRRIQLQRAVAAKVI